MAFSTKSDPLLSSSQLRASTMIKSTAISEAEGPLSPPWDDDEDLMDFKLDESLTMDDDIEELLSCSPNSLGFDSENDDLFSSFNSRNRNPEDPCSWSDDDVIVAANETDEKFSIDSLDSICDIILENISLLESNSNVGARHQDGTYLLDSSKICEDLFGSEGSMTDQSRSLSSCDSFFSEVFNDSPQSIYPNESESPRKCPDTFGTSPIHSPGHCSVCKVCFQSSELLKVHREEFLKKNICCQCNKKLENTSKLRNHWRKHNKEKPFQCTRCGKYYSQKNSLVRHQNLYCETIKIKKSLYLNNNNLMKNPDLGSEGPDSVMKRLSAPTFLDDPPFSNQKDERNFPPSVLFGQENFKSEATTKFSKSNSIKKSSNKSMNSTIAQNLTKPSSSDNWSTTERHLRDNVCKICNKDFHDPKSLENHKSMHQSRRSCCNCNKVMVSKSKLLIHCRSHTKEFPFVCQVCNKSFAERSTLRKHISTHGEKQFHCDKCGKSFARKDYLTKHSLIHRQLYKCSQCTFQCHDVLEIEMHLSQH